MQVTSMRSAIQGTLLGAGAALVLCAASLGEGLTVSDAPAVQLPPELTQEILATGLESPVALTVLPDDRILVALQRGGVVAVQPDGETVELLTVEDVESSGERGLLGIAAHPHFDDNGWLYLYYTLDQPPTRNRLGRVRIGPNGVEGTVEVLRDFDPTGDAQFHMGGALHFDSQGFLFVAIGDYQKRSPAQSVGSDPGKIHRLRDDGSIPIDNPFLHPTEGTPSSIWAYGLRNPFTFAIQPGTDRIFANDVGSRAWEEINDVVAGANFGWPVSEGPAVGNNQTAPLHAYPHSEGGCAITGGVFASDLALGATGLTDRYLFADFCAGWVRSLRLVDGAITTLIEGIDFPTNLALDRQGRLLYLSRGQGGFDGGLGGRLVRVQPAVDPSLLPRIIVQPADVNAAIGATWTLSATVENADSVQWFRNDLAIPGADALQLTLFDIQPDDDGSDFRLVATNSFGSVASDRARLRVLSRYAPKPKILAPARGTSFATGETVHFSGLAEDEEDGFLPAEVFQWEIVLRHNEHVHPFLLPESGRADGSFVMPDLDHGPGLSWLELRLSTVDQDGDIGAARRAIVPRSLVDGSRPDVMRFHQDRFFAVATLVDPTTRTERASEGVPITQDAAGFWFFKPSNLEVFLKVLDASSFSGSFWIFAGGLSDVEYTLRVWDAFTGRSWVHRNRSGEMSATGDTGTMVADEGSAVMRGHAVSSRPRTRPIRTAPSQEGESASDSELAARLLGDRFELTLDWRDPRSGNTGTGTPIDLTDESALFWFFDESNPELAIKMVDGAVVNGRFWIFFTGLTDLELTLRILDTQTQIERIYRKEPFGFLATSDLNAFVSEP